ncbi:hypothetical protein PAESOLCIP111_06579 [Paenibacillus solanacearum]|uniref:TerC family protein n=1 Tax=Paenibacillus solanacearum TaxID=2048548 RepID=A0A916NT21_9BACL|nr:TerC family protein [Paenibacillus solanacearum]CAG7652602.1 hypothetical protein PAESOLCIP111_06579 [Paenibacillus solanacearum]
MEGELLIGLLKLILINIVLSGDNAVVIALACRNLPAEHQKKAVFWGSFGAISLRIVLTFIAVWLLHIPFVQVAGGVLLIYIAFKLLRNDGHEEHVQAGSSLMEALRTVIFADLIMSLDNVLAMAGAANGNLLLISFGLVISIPLIIWGSKLLMRLMSRFPVLVQLGAGLLGYTAGEMAVGDKAVGEFLEKLFPPSHYLIPVVLGLAIFLFGFIADKRRQLQQQLAAQGK